MKSDLRKWAKEERKKYKRDEILIEKLTQTPQYKSAKNIMIFYPLPDEMDLTPLLQDKAKNFYLPKILGQELLCCPFKEGDVLCESCFKTKEPLTEPDGVLPDLVIVPALAVDKNNYRLGYGGGFYDRFLGVNKMAGKSVIKTIVCIPKELLVETVYPDEYDIPVDLVITV